ncbi:MAG: lipid-A-disaccharide synthase [Lautropia sp.]
MRGGRGGRVGMVAGEASGDLLAAEILKALNGAGGGAPDVDAPQTAGIGGERMVASGFDAWWGSEQLAVHGYAEALKVLPKLLLIRRRLGSRLLDWPADAFVGIDAPDFNLGLETRLRRAGVRTLHFVSPSIWAWRRERIGRIREAVDQMLLVFPFEEAIYRDAGVPARYCGHPLADRIPLQPDRDAARRALGVDPAATVIAVLPGSRRSEIARLAPPFIETIARLAGRRPSWVFLVPAAGATRFAELRRLLAQAAPDADVRLLLGHSHDALAACDATLIASGTATLEAMLYKRPMVIAYRLGDLDYRRMKRQAYLPWAGLPNILFRDFVVPEFIQDAVQPEAMAQALMSAVEDRTAADRLAERFAEQHHALRRDCARQVADAVREAVDGARRKAA